jgi:hypothetical protein
VPQLGFDYCERAFAADGVTEKPCRRAEQRSRACEFAWAWPPFEPTVASELNDIVSCAVSEHGASPRVEGERASARNWPVKALLGRSRDLFPDHGLERPASVSQAPGRTWSSSRVSRTPEPIGLQLVQLDRDRGDPNLSLVPDLADSTRDVAGGNILVVAIQPSPNGVGAATGVVDAEKLGELALVNGDGATNNPAGLDLGR